MPWWAAVVAATLVVSAGAHLGGEWFPWSIVVGCVAVAFVAERRAFFTVLAQPPLITAVVGAATVLFGKPVLAAATELSTAFPHLVATLVLVGVVVGMRRLSLRR